MRKKLVSALLLFSFGGILLPFGCAPSDLTLRPGESQAVESRQDQLRRENALRSFIRGATSDANGKYAEAILEYQEALLHRPNAAIYDALARDFSRLGKHARAAETAREAVRLDSLNITYRENLARVYLNALQPDLAIREFEAILRIDSSSTASWYQLAQLLEQARPLRALQIYQRLLDSEGDNLDVLYRSAAISSMLKRYVDAADYFRRMIELEPGNRGLQRELAEAYAKSGKMDDAIKILERLLEIDQNDAETIVVLAEIYFEQKNFARATELHERLLKQGIDNPNVKLRIGVGFFGQSEHDSTYLERSREVFDEVRTALPNDWRPYWYLGLIASTRRQDSLARQFFERVTHMAPWNSDAWWLLGTNYFDSGNPAKAAEVMERARKEVSEEDFRVFFLLGLSYSRTGDTSRALKNLEQAYRINPKDLNTISTLALTYEGMKRYEDSDRLYEEALRIDSTVALVLNNYGYSLAERGLQLDRALEMAKSAVAAEPENPSYLDTLGWIYFKLGRPAEAVGPIEKAVLGEASSVVQEHLGDVYYQLGKIEQAKKMWQKALESDPKNIPLQEKILRGTL